MEELFKNKTKCSKKEYNMFIKSHEKQYGFKENLYTLFYMIFFICFFITAIINRGFVFAIFILIMASIIIFYRVIRPNKVVKKELKSKKIVNEEVNTFIFYKYFYRVKNKKDMSNFSYFKIHKVLENNTHFYIYLDSKRAFVLSKQGFIKGNSEEFSKFLRRRVWFRYKKKVNKEKN